MPLETGTYIDSLNASNPASGDLKSEGDDHLRLIKSTIKSTFPNISGAVTPTHTQLNSALVPDGSGNYLVNTATNPFTMKVCVNGAVSSTQFNLTPGTGNPADLVNRDGSSLRFYVNAGGTLAMTINADGSVTIPGALNAAIPWTSVSGKPSNISYFSNDSGYQTTSGTVANLSGGSVNATTVVTSGGSTIGGNLSCAGLVFGHSGSGGTGLGRITTTNVTGSPAGTNVGDMVLVY